MSVNCVASPTDPLARFSTIWHVDFEFRQDAYLHPLPVCMFAKEQRSGREIFMWRDELLACLRVPFDTGPHDLMVAYQASAELECFRLLNWQFPYNVLDAYVETIAAINGQDIVGLEKKRPNILEALALFNLPSAYTKAEKDAMRDLILNNETYTNEQRALIKPYNMADVDDTLRLLPALVSTTTYLPLDVQRALYRGRFMASAITPQQLLGLPIDKECLERFLENWEFLQRHYIDRDDDFGLYDGTSFVEQQLEDLVKAKRWWDWPRTPTGKCKKDNHTFGKWAKRYPELKRTAHMMGVIGELRLNDLAEAVGVDGFCRSGLKPFGGKSGRNQAPGKTFLPALPSWLRGLLKPPPGWTLIELDWSAQELGLIAALSKDPAMIDDFRSGDPYWSFGIRSGLVSVSANKADHREFRNKVLKPVVLGQNYGMTPYGVAAATGRSLRWARDIHARHRRTYPIFHRYLGDIVTQAKFDRVIYSPHGWPMAVTGETKHRTLMNYMAQASGSDAMRVTGIAANEAGIRVCGSVHDSFWILVPEGTEDTAIATMEQIMMDASAAVCGLPIPAEVKAIITSRSNYGNMRQPGDRGYEMWAEVQGLLNDRLRQTG
jgi:hypothetical protein